MNAKPTASLPAEKIPALAAAVNAACDAQDGVKDGVINDPRACRFDPVSLACKAGDATDCLLPEQVKTVRRIYAGVTDGSWKNGDSGADAVGPKTARRWLDPLDYSRRWTGGEHDVLQSWLLRQLHL